MMTRKYKILNPQNSICRYDRYNKEYGITDRHIIGVLTVVVADNIKNKSAEGIHFFCTSL